MFKFGRPYYSFNLTATPGFEGVAFPMIRRVFTRLLADDIVAVQPMAAPMGLLYFIGEFKVKSFKFGRKWKQQ